MAETSPADIVVVGATCMDLIAYTERFPVPGETRLGTHFASTYGGKAANTAVQSALLYPIEKRHRVALVALLGQDAYGDSYLAYLKKIGINPMGVLRAQDPNLSTGIAHITVRGDGENAIIVIQGANAHLSATHMLQENIEKLITHAKVVCCQHEIATATNLCAFRLAKAATRKVWTLLSPSPIIEFVPELYALTDYVVVNIHEAEAIIGSAFPSGESLENQKRWSLLLRKTLLEKLKVANVPIVGFLNTIITNGEKDCHYNCATSVDEQATYSGVVKVLSVPPHKIASTVGAGDAFVGAFAYFLIHSFGIEAAIQRASVVAGHSILGHGTSTSYWDAPHLPPELLGEAPNSMLDLSSIAKELL